MSKNLFIAAPSECEKVRCYKAALTGKHLYGIFIAKQMQNFYGSY